MEKMHHQFNNTIVHLKLEYKYLTVEYHIIPG
jgi:hypothetical protein